MQMSLEEIQKILALLTRTGETVWNEERQKKKESGDASSSCPLSSDEKKEDPFFFVSSGKAKTASFSIQKEERFFSLQKNKLMTLLSHHMSVHRVGGRELASLSMTKEQDAKEMQRLLNKEGLERRLVAAESANVSSTEASECEGLKSEEEEGENEKGKEGCLDSERVDLHRVCTLRSKTSDKKKAMSDCRREDVLEARRPREERRDERSCLHETKGERSSRCKASEQQRSGKTDEEEREDEDDDSDRSRNRRGRRRYLEEKKKESEKEKKTGERKTAEEEEKNEEIMDKDAMYFTWKDEETKAMRDVLIKRRTSDEDESQTEGRRGEGKRRKDKKSSSNGRRRRKEEELEEEQDDKLDHIEIEVGGEDSPPASASSTCTVTVYYAPQVRF